MSFSSSHASAAPYPARQESEVFQSDSIKPGNKGSRDEESISSSYSSVEDVAPITQTPIPLGLNKYVLLLCGCFIAFMVGPVIMNWSEVASFMRKDGIYVWVCDESDEQRMMDLDTNTCSYRESILGDIGIFAQACFFIGAFVGGCLMDQFGPKFVAILGSLGYSVSYLLLGIGSRRVKTYYAFGIVQGLSIELCFYSVCTIPNLFPKHRGLALSILAIARSLSMLIATFLDYVRTSHYDSNKIGFTFCCISLAVLLFVVFLTPHRPFKIVNEQGEILHRPVESKRIEYKIWEYTIGQPFYMIWTLGYALLFARTQFHIISMAEGLQNVRVRYAFGYLVAASCALCPLIGYCIDLVGSIPIIFVLNLLGTASFICLFFDQFIVAQWFSVVLLTVVLSFMGAQNYALIQEYYVERYVGKLCGLVTCIGGLFSLTNMGMSHWAQLQDKTKQADAIFVVYSVLSSGVLAVLWWGPPILFVNPCFPHAPNASIASFLLP